MSIFELCENRRHPLKKDNLTLLGRCRACATEERYRNLQNSKNKEKAMGRNQRTVVRDQDERNELLLEMAPEVMRKTLKLKGNLDDFESIVYDAMIYELDRTTLPRGNHLLSKLIKTTKNYLNAARRNRVVTHPVRPVTPVDCLDITDENTGDFLEYEIDTNREDPETPESILEKEERHLQNLQLLENLPPVEQKIINLLMDGFSVKQIVKETGLDQSTVYRKITNITEIFKGE